MKLAARAQSFASSHWGVSRVACRVVQRRSTSRISDVTTFLQVRHRVWESNSAFNVVLHDPTKYGFVDNTSFGQTGDFWANDFHPSSASTSRVLSLQVSASANCTFVFLSRCRQRTQHLGTGRRCAHEPHRLVLNFNERLSWATVGSCRDDVTRQIKSRCSRCAKQFRHFAPYRAVTRAPASRGC